MLRRGYTIAENMHRGQMRKSGEPYITHPLAVAQICAELGMDTTTLVAALLHDTVEDTRYTLEALHERLRPRGGPPGRRGDQVRQGVLRQGRRGRDDPQDDRRGRQGRPGAGHQAGRPAAQHAHARTPAPPPPGPGSPARPWTCWSRSATGSASRPSSATSTTWCCCHLEPEEHARHRPSTCTNRPGWDDYLDDVVSARTRTALRRSRVDAEVTPRPRHYYSIWKDTVAGGHTVPFDLPRIAVVVDGPATDCYAALGAIHGQWRPVAGRFKDFIASPEEQPLPLAAHHRHSARTAALVEVLIRTEEMHRYCRVRRRRRLPLPQVRRGRRRRPAPSSSTWLRRVLDWQQDTADPAQFLESLRCDLAEGQIRSSPTGRQVDAARPAPPRSTWRTSWAPSGATSAWPPRINGRLAPLSSAAARRRRGGDLHRDRRPRSSSRPTRAARPAPGVARLRQVHRTPRCRSTAASPSTPSRASRIADKVRLGRATIGLALRKHDRGLASEVPLRRLAEELGYPDLETMLVAVCDRDPRAGRGGRAAHRPGRPPAVTGRPRRARAQPATSLDGMIPRSRAAGRAVAYQTFYRLPVPLRRRLVRLVVPKYIVGAVTLVRDSEAAGAGRLLLLRQPPGRGWALPGRPAQTRRAPRWSAPPASCSRSPASGVAPDELRPGRAERDRARRGRGSTWSSTPRCRRRRTALTVDGAEVLEAAWYPLDDLPRLTAPTARLLGHYGIGPLAGQPAAGRMSDAAVTRSPAAVPGVEVCAVVLAAGEGTRLRPLTERAAQGAVPGRQRRRCSTGRWPGWPGSAWPARPGRGQRLLPGRPGGRARRRPGPPVGRAGGPLGTAGGVAACGTGSTAAACWSATPTPTSPTRAAPPARTSPRCWTAGTGDTVRLLGQPAADPARPADFGGHALRRLLAAALALRARPAGRPGDLVRTVWRPAEAAGELTGAATTASTSTPAPRPTTWPPTCTPPAGGNLVDPTADGDRPLSTESVVGAGARVHGACTRAVVWPGGERRAPASR